VQGRTSDERVILGGHIDSINSRGATLGAPGADDDASGTATVLEAAVVLLRDRTFSPALTVEFHGYAAEEMGLWGSQAIADSYKSTNIAVRCMVQFDMTGWVSGNPVVVTDYTDSTLTSSLRTIAQQASGLTFGTDRCGYACSDHASWNRAGYRASFPFESAMNRDNPYIHTTSDTLSQISPDRVALFAKVAVAMATEYSK